MKNLDRLSLLHIWLVLLKTSAWRRYHKDFIVGTITDETVFWRFNRYCCHLHQFYHKATIATFKYWYYSQGFDGNFPVVFTGMTSTANDSTVTYDRLTMNADIAAKELIKSFSAVLTDTIGSAHSFSWKNDSLHLNVNTAAQFPVR